MSRVALLAVAAARAVASQSWAGQKTVLPYGPDGMYHLECELYGPGASSGCKIVSSPAPANFEYTQISVAADCCRSNGLHISRGGDGIHGSFNGEAASPAVCMDLCTADSSCTHFSHATEWNNCVLCTGCDLTDSSGTASAGMYTSWKKGGQIMTWSLAANKGYAWSPPPMPPPPPCSLQSSNVKMTESGTPVGVGTVMDLSDGLVLGGTDQVYVDVPWETSYMSSSMTWVFKARQGPVTTSAGTGPYQRAFELGNGNCAGSGGLIFPDVYFGGGSNQVGGMTWQVYEGANGGSSSLSLGTTQFWNAPQPPNNDATSTHVFAFTSAASDQAAFRDGVRLGESNSNTGTPTSIASQFWIGRSVCALSSVGFWEGNMYWFAAFNSKLTDSQIAAMTDIDGSAAAVTAAAGGTAPRYHEKFGC